MEYGINELRTNITEQLSKRVTSPFLSTYFLSWLVVNFDWIFLAISGATWNAKVQIIQSSFDGYLSYRTIYPLISALFFVVVWPALEILLFFVTSKIKSIRVKVHARIHAGGEVSEELHLEMTNQLDSRIEELQSQLNEKKKAAAQLAEQVSGYDRLKAEKSKLEKRLDSALEKVASLEVGINEREMKIERLSNSLNELDSERAGTVKKLNLSNEELDELKKQVKELKKMTQSSVISGKNSSVVTTKVTDEKKTRVQAKFFSPQGVDRITEFYLEDMPDFEREHLDLVIENTAPQRKEETDPIKILLPDEWDSIYKINDAVMVKGWTFDEWNESLESEEIINRWAAIVDLGKKLSRHKVNRGA